MAWLYTELAKTLAGLYYTQDAIVGLLVKAGMRPSAFPLNGSAEQIFIFIIRRSEQTGELSQLISLATSDFPNNPLLSDISTGSPPETWHRSVYAGPEPEFGKPDNEHHFEQLINTQSTLLPISFLSKGLQCARSVCRIVTPIGMGTGFLISSSNILLTNNHVLPSKSLIKGTAVQFNYEKDLTGIPVKPEQFLLDTDFYHTNISDDWTILRVQGDAAARWGHIPLKNQMIAENDFVNIIQHPGGEFKAIALYHNVVVGVKDGKVRYLTDTMRGSSGSPVFDSEWNVVALHHSGGESRSLLKGKLLYNEGISIDRVTQGTQNLI